MAASDDNPSLGHVTHGDTRAELFADRTWKVVVAGRDSPPLAELLEARYLGEFVGPQYGYPGEAVLQDLAAKTGGTAHPAPHPVSPPGTVY